MTELKNFTMAEFELSQVATRRGILNRVPADLLGNATATLLMLQRIRNQLSAIAGRDVPVIISSGYRSPQVNVAVGGSPTSDHPRAMAADWTAPAFGTPLQVCRALVPHLDALQIGQLIHEFGSWVHTSMRTPAKLKNRVITISRAGASLGIQEV